jgi:hypothetical protein
MVPISGGMGGIMWRIGVEEFEATRKRAGVNDDDVDDLWELLYHLFTKWEGYAKDIYINPNDIEKIKQLAGPVDAE